MINKKKKEKNFLKGKMLSKCVNVQQKKKKKE